MDVRDSEDPTLSPLLERVRRRLNDSRLRIDAGDYVGCVDAETVVAELRAEAEAVRHIKRRGEPSAA